MAISLRREGQSFAQIGQTLGITKQSAHNLVKTALDRLADETREITAQWRALEADRLDCLQVAAWDKAMEGNLPAVDRVLKIMERRAKLLALDQPIKVAQTTHDGNEGDPGRIASMTPEEREARIVELEKKRNRAQTNGC